MVHIIKAFISEPTVTNIFTDRFRKSREPVFTVCPKMAGASLRPMEYNSSALALYGLTYDQYKSGNTRRIDFNWTAVTVHEAAVWKLEEIIQYVSIEDNFGTIFETRPGMKNWTDFWSPAYPSENSGRCYTFDPSKRNTETEIKVFALVGKNGSMSIRIHGRGQTSDPELYENIDVNPDYEIKYKTSIEIIKMLNTKNFPCYTGDYDEKLFELAKKKMIEVAGCVVPYIPRKRGEQICETRNLTQKAAEVYSKMLIKSGILTRDVAPPCIQFKHWSITESYNFFTGGKAVFNFQSTVRIVEQKKAFTIYDFFASAGGYIGLLLGYSLNNLTSLLDITVKDVKNAFKA